MTAAQGAMGKASEDEAGMLTAIKVLHTVVWALLAGAIVALPFLAVQGAFRWAAIFSVVILIECSCAAGEWVAMPDDGSGSEIHRLTGHRTSIFTCRIGWPGTTRPFLDRFSW